MKILSVYLIGIVMTCIIYFSHLNEDKIKERQDANEAKRMWKEDIIKSVAENNESLRIGKRLKIIK